MADGRTIRVLVADDEPTFLAALTDLFHDEPGMVVVASASDGDEALALALEHRPDVAVIDAGLITADGIPCTRSIGDLRIGINVLALCTSEDSATVTEAIRSGAKGLVVRGAPIADIIESVEKASRGLLSMSGPAAAAIARELDGHLSRRDRDERERRLGLAQVRRAFEPGAIGIVLQPIFELATGTLVGHEALARFDLEPRLGPDRWFALADAVGLRADLELAAMLLAAHQLDELPAGTYLALNISPSTIVSDGFGAVAAGFADDRVVLEITEHAPVADYEAVAERIAPIRAAGGRLAVDDAGAGFASLRHILRLDPDIIKLDIDLTRGIEHDRARRSLASALIAFSEAMGIQVVAEGIENQADLGALTTLGVRYGQGYHLGRPHAALVRTRVASALATTDRG